MKLVLSVLMLALLPAISQAQTFRCANNLVRPSIFVEQTVQHIEYQPVVVERTQVVEYAPVEVFDVQCALKIAEDYMACSATATTRRERFRCAFGAALSNIDCIVGGFTTSSSQRRVFFPRVKARRYARQLVRQ